jgi:hypothetical protein
MSVAIVLGIIIFISQFVPQNNCANLLNLIGFCFGFFGLQIQNFFDTFFSENVVTSANPFIKAELL